MLVAAWLDYGIRIRTNETKDLDDILLAMQSAAAAAPDALATELLLAELQAGAGWDARTEIEALTLTGNTVALPANLYAPCGTVSAVDTLVWERGFDFDATAAAGWVIQGVETGSRAYEAGLRNGMLLNAWSETSEDFVTPTEKTAMVTAEGGQISLTWLPAARETRPVRQFALATDLPPDASDACRKRLSGL
jgi:predicted metalloprotease with PDZ domain